MRNIISVQLEWPSCSESLMVYSKCLMNIKLKTPARNTDLSAHSWRSIKRDCGYGKNSKIPVGKNDTKLMWMTQEFWKWCLKMISVFRRRLLPSMYSCFNHASIDNVKHISHALKEHSEFYTRKQFTTIWHLCLLQHVFSDIKEWSFIASPVLSGVIWQPDISWMIVSGM